MKICVVGLGRIGTPLAAQFAAKGHHVVGVDVNPRIVDHLNAGTEPFPGETGLADALAAAHEAGTLRATTDHADAVPGADAVVIVVPLLVDEQTWLPDFSIMDAATAQVAASLTAGTLVSYETTLPVGTTRHRWRPLLEQGSGLVEGTDFHVVFSPERVLTGRVFRDLRRYPKLIGALSAAGAARAREFYEAVLDFDERDDLPRANGVWDLGSAEASELAKLAETTYRDVNIGLANQFARYAARCGVDIYRVIEASNSQPYSHIHRPGVAVGGHCIPVYPRLYLSGDPDATIVRAAREANAAMPDYTVSLVTAALGGLAGRRVAVLGAAYRGNAKDTVLSGVFPVVAALEAGGAAVVVHDPFHTPDELRALGFEPYRRGEAADAVLVQTDHAAYREWGAVDVPGAAVLVDGRNVTDPVRWTGLTRIVVGQPAP